MRTLKQAITGCIIPTCAVSRYPPGCCYLVFWGIYPECNRFWCGAGNDGILTGPPGHSGSCAGGSFDEPDQRNHSFGQVPKFGTNSFCLADGSGFLADDPARGICAKQPGRKTGDQDIGMCHGRLRFIGSVGGSLAGIETSCLGCAGGWIGRNIRGCLQHVRTTGDHLRKLPALAARCIQGEPDRLLYPKQHIDLCQSCLERQFCPSGDHLFPDFPTSDWVGDLAGVSPGPAD